MGETVDVIQAMRHQEDSGYETRGFMDRSLQLPVNPLSLDVDGDCRKKMAAWSYQVVDFCKFSRESVEISMSYLDRYLLTPAGTRALLDRSVFQLAAMTSLYTAVKIHEPEAMDPKLVSSLSRGAYIPQQVEQMEAVLLAALQWRLNPPTALSFVRQFFNLIPFNALDEETRKMAYDVTKYQTELAVSEYDFVAIKPSVIAYCSLMNSLQSLDLDCKLLSYISTILAQSIGLDVANNDSVANVQSFLYEAIVRQPAFQHISEKQQVIPKSPKEQQGRGVSIQFSPRSTVAL
jgi:hypothetical protein